MRVDILDTPCDALTMAETVERVRDALQSRSVLHQVSLNVAKLVNMRSDPLLREDVLASHIISADGMGIVLAGTLLGRPIPERVTGIDLMDAVLAVCAKEGFRPYFLGARPEVVRRAVEVATYRHDGLTFAGWRDGFYSADQEQAVVDEIVATDADCLFIGMPTPRKERFLRRHRDRMNIPYIMGVGGSFDVMAGLVSRAPLWMQKAGLEWAHRVVQEPRRMWWRYASTNTTFAFLVARYLTMSLLTSSRKDRTAC